jgi:hypothetical protein
LFNEDGNSVVKISFRREDRDDLESTGFEEIGGGGDWAGRLLWVLVIASTCTRGASSEGGAGATLDSILRVVCFSGEEDGGESKKRGVERGVSLLLMSEDATRM